MSLTEVAQYPFLRSATKVFAESLHCSLDDQGPTWLRIARTLVSTRTVSSRASAWSPPASPGLWPESGSLVLYPMW